MNIPKVFPRVFVGLQNAEDKYSKTRHNAGAILVSHYIQDKGVEFKFDKFSNSYKAVASTGNFYLPNTYMNLSGESIAKIIKNEKEDTENLVIFFDDVTIPVGQYKISVKEGASSHNGIKSIIDHTGKNDFVRVRIGVGKVVDGKLLEPGPDKMSDFVLSNLNNLEISQIKSLASEILEKLQS
mgnify:CR=1 FL=1